jgi:hypothetical protein
VVDRSHGRDLPLPRSPKGGEGSGERRPPQPDRIRQQVRFHLKLKERPLSRLERKGRPLCPYHRARCPPAPEFCSRGRCPMLSGELWVDVASTAGRRSARVTARCSRLEFRGGRRGDPGCLPDRPCLRRSWRRARLGVSSSGRTAPPARSEAAFFRMGASADDELCPAHPAREPARHCRPPARAASLRPRSWVSSLPGPQHAGRCQ